MIIIEVVVQSIILVVYQIIEIEYSLVRFFCLGGEVLVCLCILVVNLI